MDFRYTQLDRRAKDLRRRIAELERLFRHLVLALSGDVRRYAVEVTAGGRRAGATTFEVR